MCIRDSFKTITKIYLVGGLVSRGFTSNDIDLIFEVDSEHSLSSDEIWLELFEQADEFLMELQEISGLYTGVIRLLKRGENDDDIRHPYIILWCREEERI